MYNSTVQLPTTTIMHSCTNYTQYLLYNGVTILKHVTMFRSDVFIVSLITFVSYIITKYV